MAKKKKSGSFEQRFGRYAIPNLSLILVMCYVAGYVITLVNGNFMSYLNLNPYRILHGEIWRIFTWVISPPSELSIFTLIMLFFYYSIGTTLERTWGTYRYNVYIFGGILITVIAAILCMGVCWLLPGAWFEGYPGGVAGFFEGGALMFSTYYINMSIFLAFAATWPEMQVLLMFVIPVKVKWLGIIYGVMLLIDMVRYFMFGFYLPIFWFGMVAIGASLVNFLIFWMRNRRWSHLNPKQIRRKVHFQQQVRDGVKQSGHRCCICGRTDADDPTLEFRYCSKCAGNYEYCQQHLFTHEHKV
ncbi:MAG: hypothetical protein NC079_02595 [Clostridium sp.]|nr:hypothetical protein [Acetatifactor muris]MCM1527197.1 hypothetical protein [Bacteroides sp.]MCM1562478.1 hypothetical protein [Clostridium sp.]